MIENKKSKYADPSFYTDRAEGDSTQTMFRDGVFGVGLNSVIFAAFLFVAIKTFPSDHGWVVKSIFIYMIIVAELNVAALGMKSATKIAGAWKAR